MSDTPRTDAAEVYTNDLDDAIYAVPSHVVRQLERELAEARSEHAKTIGTLHADLAALSREKLRLEERIPEGRDTSKRAFMDGIDWQHHLGVGNDPKGAVLYPSEKDTLRGEACLAKGAGCGIVEVEVRLIRWAVEQDLEGEMKRKRESMNDGSGS